MINLYDFDKTIYDGDSTIDFYLYCLLRKPLLIRYLPVQLWHILLYLLGVESKTKVKGKFFVFLRGLDGVERYVEGFWKRNAKKIKPWYKPKEGVAVIISASPEFLLLPMLKQLKARMIIATKVDPRTGIIEGDNCYGGEKVVRLMQEIAKPAIAETYSDSLSDLPILELANKQYMVIGHKIMTLEEFQTLSRFRRFFLR